MSVEIDTPTQREVVLCYLEHEREQWLPNHIAAQRGAWDAETRATLFMRRIDKLLDELIVLDHLDGSAAE